MISVNKDTCIGCGACTATCSDVFKMGEDGKVDVANQENLECAKNAVGICPVGAIEVE